MMRTAQRRFAQKVIGMPWNPDRHQIGMSDRHRWNTHLRPSRSSSSLRSSNARNEQNTCPQIVSLRLREIGRVSPDLTAQQRKAVTTVDLGWWSPLLLSFS